MWIYIHDYLVRYLWRRLYMYMLEKASCDRSVIGYLESAPKFVGALHSIYFPKLATRVLNTRSVTTPISNTDLYFLIKILFLTSWVVWHNSIEYHDAECGHVHLLICFLFLQFQKWDSNTKISISIILSTLSKLIFGPQISYYLI